MSATRVIIDMQPDFKNSERPEVLVGVTKEILAAKTENAAIIVVEYFGSGPTHAGLLKLLKDYGPKAKVRKWRDDGSDKVFQCLKKFNFGPYHLRICGVNSDCCVYETVEGLSALLPAADIEVVKSACNRVSKRDWSLYHRFRNVRLVE